MGAIPDVSKERSKFISRVRWTKMN